MNRSGFTIVSENGLFGLTDENGVKVIPCEYDKILDYDDDGYIRLIKGDVYSTINLECNVAIPLSDGITHLGVFYDEIARAKKGDKWGLVDVNGNELTEFNYIEIYAHRKGGYVAVDQYERKGWLNDYGEFTPFAKQTSSNKRSRFREIKTYHDGIAPALTCDLKWVFVDKEYNQVNAYEYNSMDPVLRGGLYTVAKLTEKGRFYTVTSYDGKPISNEMYDYPLHFENGISLCSRKHLDENGNEIRIPFNGQPLYDYGILRNDGTYLFPMVYHKLHWNNYQEKNCWFAEDEKACYLLYPDGCRRVYDKSKAHRDWNALEYIPKNEIRNYISETELEAIYEPEVVIEKHLYGIDEDEDDYTIQYRRLLINTLKICIGDISRLYVDAIVEFNEPSKTTFGKIYKVKRKPYKNIIKPNFERKDIGEQEDMLISFYNTALDIAAKRNLHNIAFPGNIRNLDISNKKAIKTALHVIKFHLTRKKFNGDVIICCNSEKDAEIYKELLESEN